jgi:hypothetical protein
MQDKWKYFLEQVNVAGELVDKDRHGPHNDIVVPMGRIHETCGLVISQLS